MNIKERIVQSYIGNQILTLIRWKLYRPVNRFPLGHFYSPIVSELDLNYFDNRIWEEPVPDFIPGLNLNIENQLSLLEELSVYYSSLPFQYQKSDKSRYYYNNNSYTYTDAIVLYSFIRHFQPKRIIEIGSGFSSAVMLDTRDLFCNNIDITFIEPYPTLLYSLFKEEDRHTCEVIDSKVQNVDIDRFLRLEKNDVLFIDSSHVSKTGSDVNYEIFKILLALKSGVIIHFHDIFYPFEYPKEWVYSGRNWNEIYLLRAFLSYNNDFEILLFSHYIHTKHSSAFEKMPLTYKDKGANLWIKKK